MIQQIGMEEFASIAYENSTAVLQQPKVETQGSPQNQLLKGTWNKSYRSPYKILKYFAFYFTFGEYLLRSVYNHLTI